MPNARASSDGCRAMGHGIATCDAYASQQMRPGPIRAHHQLSCPRIGIPLKACIRMHGWHALRPDCPLLVHCMPSSMGICPLADFAQRPLPQHLCTLLDRWVSADGRQHMLQGDDFKKHQSAMVDCHLHQTLCHLQLLMTLSRQLAEASYMLGIRCPACIQYV